MIRPNRFLYRMIAFLIAVAVVAVMLREGLVLAFAHNPALNGLLVGVLLIGIVLNFRQVLMLSPEIDWLDSWRRGQPSLSGGRLRLLAPMARMLGERHDRMSLSAMALRSVLDSIAARLEEQRDLSRYLVGLMIFLGLLGTFWGLSRTVGSIGEVIGSLTAGGGTDPAGAFERLKAGLGQPLSGMGTAFSTSLFGLAGSLALGFLDLSAGQAQNAFYNDLEEWLAGQTKLGASGRMTSDETGGASVPAYIQALLEQTADSLDQVQRAIMRSEDNRGGFAGAITQLSDKLSVLNDHMRAEQALLLKLGEGQLETRNLLARLAENSTRDGGLDDPTRSHIRAMDGSLKRLVEETVASRQELVTEFRGELRLLARTIAALADAAPER